MTHALLGLAEATVNRALGLDPELARILEPLNGKCMQFRLEPGVGLAMMITFHGDGVVFLDPDARVADVELTGSLLALLGLLPAQPFGTSDQEITIRGDSAVLMELKRALVRLRIDWHEPITQIFGDTLGHSMAQGLEQLSRIFSAKAHSLWLDTKEYLGEESGLLENAHTVAEFCAEVDQLRDATARLEKRLQRLSALAIHGENP